MISLDRLVSFFGCCYIVPHPSFGKTFKLLPLLMISAFCGKLGRSSEELMQLKKISFSRTWEIWSHRTWEAAPQQVGELTRRQEHSLSLIRNNRYNVSFLALRFGSDKQHQIASFCLVCLFSLLLKIAWQNIPHHGTPGNS